MAIFSEFDYQNEMRRRDERVAFENWRVGTMVPRPYKLPGWRPKVDGYDPSQRSAR